MSTALLVALADARSESEFGGKAVGLAAACRAGLPVPRGVALSADLVDSFLSGERAAVAALRSLPGDLGAAIAVRSSALGEDRAHASFAGQHESRLGVRDFEQLSDAIARVSASARSAAALAYRKKLGLAGQPRMGIVVQTLVDPQVAGVLFTRHPVSGADEIVIEASWGLGEAVVQGLVIPDRYRLSPSGDILERSAGHKSLAIRARAAGGTEREDIDAARASALCLDDSTLCALYALAGRCDAHFDGPSDIEWALAGGSLYLLQRRRIAERVQ